MSIFFELVHPDEQRNVLKLAIAYYDRAGPYSVEQIMMGYKLSDGSYLEYKGKSDTPGREADDVWYVTRGRSIIGKIRIVGGLDVNSDSTTLIGETVEVKDNKDEPPVWKTKHIVHTGGRRKNSRRKTKRARRNRRRSHRRN